MRANNRTLLLGAMVVVVVLFATILIGIFKLRSGSGDVFAPYSTYRSDPLGSMALYNALAELDGITTERYIRPFNELPHGEGKTLLLAGAYLSLDPIDAIEAIEGFASQGGRVVLAFHPLKKEFELDRLHDAIRERDRTEESVPLPSPPTTDEDGDPAGLPGLDKEDTPLDISEDGEVRSAPAEEPTDFPAADADEPENADGTAPPAEHGKASDEDATEDETGGSRMWGPRLLDISERWPFEYKFKDPGTGFQTTPAGSDSPSATGATWISGLYFKYPDEKWTPRYVRPDGSDELPEITVMERAMGAGSIVLSSDSYFMSNDALREHRASQFIDSVILGGNSAVLFSEVHLGTEQKERIMTLVRRYRLHSVLFALILIGVLFVWRNATTLVPRREWTPARQGIPATALERSHQDGLDNLLARFVPPNRLLDTCVTEWMHQFHRNPRAADIQKLRDAFADPAEEAKNVVEAYNRLAREVRKN